MRVQRTADMRSRAIVPAVCYHRAYTPALFQHFCLNDRELVHDAFEPSVPH
jgi:hypothetical protein